MPKEKMYFTLEEAVKATGLEHLRLLRLSAAGKLRCFLHLEYADNGERWVEVPAKDIAYTLKHSDLSLDLPMIYLQSEDREAKYSYEEEGYVHDDDGRRSKKVYCVRYNITDLKIVGAEVENLRAKFPGLSESKELESLDFENWNTPSGPIKIDTEARVLSLQFLWRRRPNKVQEKELVQFVLDNGKPVLDNRIYRLFRGGTHPAWNRVIKKVKGKPLYYLNPKAHPLKKTTK